MPGLGELLEAARFRLSRWRDRLRERRHGKEYRQRVFIRIHDENLWGDHRSISGGGSAPESTRAICEQLPTLWKRHGIRTLVDAPCGDFLWMREIVHHLDDYTGLDIVPALIEKNQAEHGTDRVRFACADLTSDPLPQADAILCRDCLMHLPTRLIRAALTNFRASGARYVFLTSDGDAAPYYDIPTGRFRRINLFQPPFNFPPPLDLIQEDPAGERLARTLNLWRLADLPAEIAPSYS